MAHTKTNRVVSFLLSVVLLFALSSVFCIEKASASELDGDWQYEVEGSYAVITGYIGNEPNITVPKTVGGLTVSKVTSLVNGSYKTKTKSVTLSSGIKEIGNGVFYGYTALTSVQFPDTLRTIGSNAFYGCTSLTGIVLPSSVTSIGESAFESCTGLYSANLTCGATTLPDRIFRDCTSLTTVTLPLYITSVGNDAFNGCTKLTKVDIPDTVKKIGKNAFYGCTLLSSARMPIELNTLGETAFGNCKSLTSVTLRNNINTICEGAFINCSSLKEVYIGNSLNVMEKEIFIGCTNLEKVVFGGKYINFGGIFDNAAHTVVYYPNNQISSWNDYYGDKTSYTPTTTIAITGTKELTTGKTSQLKITFNPASGTFKNVYSISSSNTKVATVSDTGLVTARNAGTATITVSDINGTTGTCLISVKPAAPTGITATPKSTSSVTLKWKDMSVSGYYVYRADVKGGTYKKIATVSTNTYTDKGLTKGKTYYYSIKAYSTSESKTTISAYSTVKTYTATSPAPTTISATKTAKGTATIKWGKSTGATGYQICMKKSGATSYTVLAYTNSSTLSYKKTGLTAGKTYYFKVRSYITVNGTKVFSPFTKVVTVKV